MARLVVPRSAANGKLAADQSVANTPADNYADRLVKYIPAESVTFYLVVDKIVASHFGLHGSSLPTPVPMAAIVVSWAIFVLGIVGTPIYLRRKRLPDQPWRLHAALSTVAFVCWTYTLSGTVFLIQHWDQALVGALVTPIFTYVAGFFEPKPE